MITKYGSVLTPNHIQLFRCFLDDWVFIHGQWKRCVARLRVKKSLYWIALSGRGPALSTGSAENGRARVITASCLASCLQTATPSAASTSRDEWSESSTSQTRESNHCKIKTKKMHEEQDSNLRVKRL